MSEQNVKDAAGLFNPLQKPAFPGPLGCGLTALQYATIHLAAAMLAANASCEWVNDNAARLAANLLGTCR